MAIVDVLTGLLRFVHDGESDLRFCFVGHSFHRKTKSTTFIVDILRELGEVDEWDSSPDVSPLVDDELFERLAKSRYDCYVFLQTEYIAERLAGLGLGRFIIIPMYDGAVSRPDSFWRRLLDSEFVSFSRALHEHLRRLDCRSHCFQYFPAIDPDARPRPVAARTGFFWERRPDQRLNLPFVLRLCEQLDITRLHVHRAADFAGLLPPDWHARAVASETVEITTSGWFDSADAFRQVSREALFFFAPRAAEGIGMSVIEGMIAGQIVVAPDRPTMNEYVTHRVSGLLYDLDQPRVPTDLDDDELTEMAEGVIRRSRHLSAAWQRDIRRLKSVLLRDGQRWSMTDQSSHFVNHIQEAARDRAWRSVGNEQRADRS